MMRSWFWKNTRKLVLASAAISLAVHLVVITAWVRGTLPEPGMPENSIANRIFYMPPPDRIPTRAGSREAIRYIKIETPGLGSGEGARMMGEARPTTVDQTLGKTTPTADTAVAAPLAPTVGPDSVYSILQVDTAVVRSTQSAAPAYPLKLLEAHIQGYVNAQYVVDTTGFADIASFEVLTATHKEFIQAVKDALPYMRFQPAKIGPTKVRQLVQQQFSFKIDDTTAVRKKP